MVEQGDTIAIEYTWAGANTGPFATPDGTKVPPTGKSVEIKGMDLAQIRDGKIAVHHMYADTRAVIGQLGLLPGSGSGGSI